MKQPLVSVLMTAYNRERYIGEAIESVLSSSYKDFELIIVDDGSKDKTVDIARAFEQKDSRVKVYLNDRNLGDYPNRNRAASYANGKYIKYVDSDDMIYSHTLRTMVDVMEKYPDAAIGISSRSQKSTTFMTPYDAYYTHFFVRGLLDHGPTAVIIRKSVFDAEGEFKEIRNVSDFDMWLRLAARYPVVEIESNLVFWREHDAQEIRLDQFKYVEFQLPIIIEHVSSPLSPLNTDQKKVIIEKYKRISARQLIKSVIRGQNIGASLRIWKKNALSLNNLF